MPKLNNDEQRKKWNKYNCAYSKKTYKALCLKLNRVHDADIIEYLENNSMANAELVKKLIREHMAKNS